MAPQRFLSFFNRGLLVSLAYVAGVPGAAVIPPVGKGVAGGLAAEGASAGLPKGIPGDWWASVQKDIRQSEYEITWQEQTALDASASPGQARRAAYQAPNRAHDFRTVAELFVIAVDLLH
jgi:hypothetical protein